MEMIILAIVKTTVLRARMCVSILVASMTVLTHSILQANIKGILMWYSIEIAIATLILPELEAPPLRLD
jgi:hypothetical protein